jgi:ribosome biogenesis GTPase / thiamine phosphate phosphatase
MNKALLELGWTDFFEQEYLPYMTPDLQPARVIGVDRTTFRIQTATQAENAMLPGALLHGTNKIMPVIGDWVVVQSQSDILQILVILKRQSEFCRAVQAGVSKPITKQVMTANVNTVLIVTGLDDDFQILRLKRYINAVQNSGALPVVILNKSDLVGNSSTYLEAVQSISSSLAVYVLSATLNLGLEQLKPYFQTGQTVALIGSSGVGKSTLTNLILGQDIALIGNSQTDHLGKHTTTARTMYFIPNGGLLVDNPGLREIAVWDEHQTDFSDIENLAAECKFRKCTHTSEFGCAVQKAIRNKKLEPNRLLEYQKMLGIKIIAPKKRKFSS